MGSIGVFIDAESGLGLLNPEMFGDTVPGYVTGEVNLAGVRYEIVGWDRGRRCLRIRRAKSAEAWTKQLTGALDEDGLAFPAGTPPVLRRASTRQAEIDANG